MITVLFHANGNVAVQQTRQHARHAQNISHNLWRVVSRVVGLQSSLRARSQASSVIPAI